MEKSNVIELEGRSAGSADPLTEKPSISCWRRQRGFNCLSKVITGVKFIDGIEEAESNQGAA